MACNAGGIPSRGLAYCGKCPSSFPHEMLEILLELVQAVCLDLVELLLHCLLKPRALSSTMRSLIHLKLVGLERSTVVTVIFICTCMYVTSHVYMLHVCQTIQQQK